MGIFSTVIVFLLLASFLCHHPSIAEFIPSYEWKDRVLSPYQMYNVDQNLVPWITNLNVLFQPFEKEHCLLEIGNYQRADIPEPNFPWITKSTVAHTTPLDLYNKSGKFKFCYLNKVKAMISGFKGKECFLNIPLYPFSAASKQWNCHVIVETFPMQRFEYHLFPDLFSESLSSKQVKSLPLNQPKPVSTTPYFRIVILQEEETLDWSAIQHCAFRIVRDSADLNPQVYHHVCYLASGSIYSNALGDILDVFPLAIQSITKIPHFVETTSSNEISISDWASSAINDLLSSGYSQPKDAVNWSSDEFVDNINNHVTLRDFVSHDCHEYLSSCELTYSSRSHYFLDWNVRGKLHDGIILQLAFVHVLRAVMGNFSQPQYIYNRRIELCNHGVEQPPHSRPMSNMVDPMYRGFSEYSYFETFRHGVGWRVHLNFGNEPKFYQQFALANPLMSLRFVSCGSRGLSPFPFKEIYNVFDQYVWMCIFISVTLLTFGMRILFNGGKSDVKNVPNISRPRGIDFLLQLIKVLLEQGDPFQQHACQMRRLKYLIAAYLLIGIVLSNGYKNSNVYNMVLPRLLQPYEKIEELTNDSYKLYTKFARANYLEMGSCLTYHFCTPDEHVCSISYQIIAISHVADALRSQPNGSQNTALEILRNHSQIVPGLINFFNTSFQQERNALMTKVKSDWTEQETVEAMSTLERKLDDVIQTWEEKQLKTYLSKCDKSALVLPTHLCQKYATEISISNKKLNIDVGGESYYNLTYFISLIGCTPPFVLRRIGGVHASGLMNWWTEFLGRERYSRDPHQEPSAATIRGNVVVIFCLWLGGMLAAISLFFIEKKAGFVGQLLGLPTFWNETVRALRWFHGMINQLIVQKPTRVETLVNSKPSDE